MRLSFFQVPYSKSKKYIYNLVDIFDNCLFYNCFRNYLVKTGRKYDEESDKTTNELNGPNESERSFNVTRTTHMQLGSSSYKKRKSRSKERTGPTNYDPYATQKNSKVTNTKINTSHSTGRQSNEETINAVDQYPKAKDTTVEIDEASYIEKKSPSTISDEDVSSQAINTVTGKAINESKKTTIETTSTPSDVDAILKLIGSGTSKERTYPDAMKQRMKAINLVKSG